MCKFLRIGTGDINLFASVAEDVFDETISIDRLAAYLESQQNRLVVAQIDGTIVGQCAAVIHKHPDKPNELYLDEVGVCPRFWRQGIAGRMVEEMITWARELGCIEAWVGTEESNDAARALYSRYTAAERIVMYSWDL